MREFKLKEKQRPDVRVREEDRPVKVPFVLMADTVLMANTVMADYKITYEEGMGTTITLKEKTRPMLTVMREEEYILINKMYDITFTITEDSTPLENVRIVIDGVEKFTSALGVAVFRLKNGTYTYQLTKVDYATVTDDVTVNSSDVSEAVSMVNTTIDPIQVLVDEYTTLVEADGGTVVNETDTYNAFDAIVTSGEDDTLWGYYVPSAGSKLDGDNYIAPLKIINTYGARQIKFIPQTISIGNVYLRVTGV
jgi:hypothetical protein